MKEKWIKRFSYLYKNIIAGRMIGIFVIIVMSIFTLLIIGNVTTKWIDIWLGLLMMIMLIVGIIKLILDVFKN